MKNMLLGKFTCDVKENGIFIPSEFRLHGKKVDLLLFQEDPWMSIQVWETLDQETLGLLEHDYHIIEKVQIEIDTNGYLKLPNTFCAQIKSDRQVLVTGIGNCIEILTMAEFEEMSHGLELLEEQFEHLW